MDPAGPEAAGTEATAPKAAKPSRTGRNLPVAIGVGALLGGLVLLTLLTVKATFLIYVGVALLIALHELAGALAKRDIKIPVILLGAGLVAVVTCEYWLGPQAAMAALALTAIAVFAWRLPGGTAGYVKDVTASVFAAVYLAFLPSFVAGSQTLFIGVGSDIAFVNFGGLKGPAIQVSPDRTSVTITLPKPQLEPAVLNVRQSYVFAEQQGLATRLNTFLGGNPNSQQALYVSAQKHIQAAAQHGPLLADAQQNTSAMLTSMLSGLGFAHVTVRFTPAA